VVEHLAILAAPIASTFSQGDPMSSRIRHVTIDCHDPYSQAAFWADVLGFVEDQDNPNAPDDPEALITDPSGRHPGLLFIKVPDAKAVKNRVHVDLVPAAMRDETVVALLARGATLVDDHRRADGTGWAVLADPEGNEFCVERSDAERGITPPSDTGSDQDYPDGIRTADERQMLSDMLDWYRDAVLRKVDGISPVTARTSPVRSGTTIAGLLKHLALVEDSWFTERFAGVDDLEPWVSAPWDDDPDWEFHSAATDPVEDVVSLYRAACDRSRTAAAGHALDDPATSPGRREFTLRFAFVHLIEETARHLGHMDILREFLDGSIGE
jgi:catechol 2,3-dioxygenase-like lactoylglutathione lyase family enzyme